MADLSIYLFWSALVISLIAVLCYTAYVASASVSLRRFAAQTEAGTVTITAQSGIPNPGIGRLATELGRPALAREHLRAFLQEFPNDPRVYTVKALLAGLPAE